MPNFIPLCLVNMHQKKLISLFVEPYLMTYDMTYPRDSPDTIQKNVNFAFLLECHRDVCYEQLDWSVQIFPIIFDLLLLILSIAKSGALRFLFSLNHIFLPIVLPIFASHILEFGKFWVNIYSWLLCFPNGVTMVSLLIYFITSDDFCVDKYFSW
jgi:hypothetical protein